MLQVKSVWYASLIKHVLKLFAKQKSLHQFKLKTFADYKVDVTQMFKFLFGPVENI